MNENVLDRYTHNVWRDIRNDAKPMAKFQRIPCNEMMNKLVASAVASHKKLVYKDILI